MKRIIFVFSIFSLLFAINASAEDEIMLMSADGPDFQNDSDIMLTGADDFGDDNYNWQDYDEEIHSGGDIYKDNAPNSAISTSEGPVLKVPSNTFPLSRSGMMVSPTPVSGNMMPPVPINSINMPQTKSNNSTKDTSASLTELFEEKSEKTPRAATVSTSETWLDRLRSSAESEIKGGGKRTSDDEIGVSSADSNLKSLVDGVKTSGDRRSNAAVFDIAGAMLRMSPKQIDEILTRKGYRKTNEKFEIPNFIKWRKEEECRAKGVIGYERLANCVVQSAKAENYQYVDRVYYSKYDTQEDIVVYFTSNFTSNKAYKITYSSMSANVTGNSQKSIYLRNIKVFDFWKRINQKYGAPDNKEDVIWGLGGNKPYMQAKTGKLLLEDPMLRELDYTRMSREDQKFINTSVYNF